MRYPNAPALGAIPKATDVSTIKRSGPTFTTVPGYIVLGGVVLCDRLLPYLGLLLRTLWEGSMRVVRRLRTFLKCIEICWH